MKTGAAIVVMATSLFFVTSCVQSERSYSSRKNYKTPAQWERPIKKKVSSCALYPKIPAPKWVINPSQVSSINYIGFGVAEGDYGNLQTRINLAHSNALTSLASSIQVKVESSLSTHISSINGKYTDNFRSISKNCTDLLIKGAVRSDQWVDRSTCNVWIQVILPKSEVRKVMDKKLREEARKRYPALIREAKANIASAKKSRSNPLTAKHLANKALGALKKINANNCNYDVRSLRNDARQIVNKITRKERLLNNLHGGMTYEGLVRINGKPEGIEYKKVFVDCVVQQGDFLCTNIYKKVIYAVNYSNYWLMFSDNRLGCVFSEEDFKDGKIWGRDNCNDYRFHGAKSILEN